MTGIFDSPDKIMFFFDTGLTYFGLLALVNVIGFLFFRDE